MGREIERKFLVNGDQWRNLAKGVHYRQGYLSSVKERAVRVRTIEDKAFLTIKGKSEGLARAEFEYEIPLEDAIALLELCEQPLIDKQRFKIRVAEHTWEVDEFYGANEGLIMAEVELESEDEDVELPNWIGEEVSHDPHYFNASLIKHPYCEW